MTVALRDGGTGNLLLAIEARVCAEDCDLNKSQRIQHRTLGSQERFCFVIAVLVGRDDRYALPSSSKTPARVSQLPSSSAKLGSREPQREYLEFRRRGLRPGNDAVIAVDEFPHQLWPAQLEEQW